MIPHRVHVWDLKTRQPVFQIATGEWVRNVAFSDDGRRIVGEFSGAAHGALLATWKLPDDVVDRKVKPESNAKDRLGDGIQWSTWGDKDGLLSGVRLILPDGGLKAGDPLVVEYRLANVSTETKTIQSLLDSGDLFASLSTGNRFGGYGLEQQGPPVASTLKSGDLFVDTEHLVSIETTGLQLGEYQVALGCEFVCYIEAEKHRIHHRGSIPVTLHGNSTVTVRELPQSNIHWGQAVAGLKVGVQWADHQGAYANGDIVEADLFAANTTDQPMDASAQLPHPGDGWLFNVEDKNGSSSMFARTTPKDFDSPQYSIHLNLAPGEVAPITGDGIRVSFLPDPAIEPSVTTVPRTKFQIVSSKDEAKQDHSEPTVLGKLVSQGGDYSAIFGVTVLRPDIPDLRLVLASTISFAVAMQQGADAPAANANSAPWGDESNGLQCRIVPVAPSMDAGQVDMSTPWTRFESPDEITFAIEIKNVSGKPIKLKDIRYETGFASETKAKLNSNHYAPHLFEFAFTDKNGQAIARSQREFTVVTLAMILSDALLTEVEPNQSLKFLLQPAKYERSTDYRLSAGDYKVQVHYRGPSPEVQKWIESHDVGRVPENA